MDSQLLQDKEMIDDLVSKMPGGHWETELGLYGWFMCGVMFALPYLT